VKRSEKERARKRERERTVAFAMALCTHTPIGIYERFRAIANRD